MNFIKHIGSQLKEARRQKGFSQAALASKVGLPQSHLSKIESGLVNLQISSLIELSRALELELMLIPRILVCTVESLQRGIDEKASEESPMYQLRNENEE